LTSEQLQTARAERWRQASNPLLTLDDAATWVDSVGLCFFLPRRQQFLAPAPSFVEACMGTPSETPTREAIENAGSLMLRLAETGAILPLNLFGALSVQPDFLATREAFRYIFSLRGDRNWKTVPGGQTSPLVVEIWKLLDKEGSLSATEIQSTLGRELTEAAVLRGLIELWSGLRVLPVLDGSESVRWELIQARFADALNAANKLSQTTALSALVSLYLESAIAASGEEIETFLSPLTSRSRVREVVHGLTATRQLSILQIGTQSMVHISGSLPEFAEDEAAPAPQQETGPQETGKGRRDSGKKPSTRAPRESEDGDRGVQRYDSEGRPQIVHEIILPSRDDRERPAREGFAARPPRQRDRPFRKPGTGTGDSKPWARKSEGERSPSGKRPFDKSAKPFRRDARPYSPRGSEGSGEGERPRSSEGQRPRSGEGRPPRSAEGRSGERRPGPRKPGFREGGKFPPKRFGASGDRPWKDRGAERGSERGPEYRKDRGSDRPSGEGRPAAGGEKRQGKFGGSFGDRPRSSGSKFSGPKSGSKFGASKFGRSKFGSGSGKPSGSGFAGKRSGGFAGKRPGFAGKDSAAEGGKRPFFRKRSEESAGGDSPSRPPFRSKFGARPAEGSGGATRPPRFDGESRPPRREGGWKPKPSGPRGASGSGGRFSKPGRSQTGTSGFSKSAKPRFDRPAKPGFGKSAKPAFGKSAKPAFGKSKFGGSKPGGGGKFGGKRFGAGKPGGPRPGNARPGGSRPPFKKRKDSGKESSE
jgi:23S rRNA pseudouridine2605 synthase